MRELTPNITGTFLGIPIPGHLSIEQVIDAEGKTMFHFVLTLLPPITEKPHA